MKSDDMENKEKLEKIAKRAAQKYEKDNKKISALIEKAEALIARAIAISEKSGTPFKIDFGAIQQVYRPKSFEEEFAKEAKKYLKDYDLSDWKRDQLESLVDFAIPYWNGWDSEHWNFSTC